MSGVPPRSSGRRTWRSLWSDFRRPFLFAFGWLFLVIGIAGIVLPLLPGTVFLIIAAACFSRSSPRFEAWLLNHPRLGPPVRRWRETGSIPLPAKAFAVASLVTSWLIMLATDAPDWAKGVCFVIFCVVAGYIVSRPTR